QRMRGRQFEGARAADQEHRAEQQVAGQDAGQQGRDDHDRGERIDAVRGAHDQAAVVTVGGVAYQQRQHDRRHELDQPDQAEIERAVGELVDLPADGHGQHLVAHGGGEPRQPEQHEGPVPGERRRFGLGRRHAQGFVRRVRSSLKNLLSSAFDTTPEKLSNFPSLAISRADLMNAFMATRASVPPTLMRRTPISSRSLTVKPNAPLLRKLIGFGATACTVATICSRVLMPGEYRQSAPASAKAFSRRMVSSRSGLPRIKPSVRAVNTTSPPALSIAARAAFTRASARSKSYSGRAGSPVESSIDSPATPVAMQRVTFSAMRSGSSAKPPSKSVLSGTSVAAAISPKW